VGCEWTHASRLACLNESIVESHNLVHCHVGRDIYPISSSSGSRYLPSFSHNALRQCSAADVKMSGYAFRADGRYFVLAERHRSKDTLGLYDTAELFKLVRVCPEGLPDI